MIYQPHSRPLPRRELADESQDAIAIVGVGCWYPGARGPAQLWENILARRREFRRFPDERLPLDEYYDPNPQTPDKTYGQRAAFIDGFEFDWASRRYPQRTFEATDVVHWLALEVAIDALSDAGLDRQTAPRDRTSVLVGNTLTGEHTRSNAMRLRWPFVRRALQTAATAQGLADSDQQQLVATMEELYKSVFASISDDTLAGGLSNTIAGRICNYFDFHGGGYTVDGACSSSLLAVCNAASQLAAGDVDLALAGGVDISLDTFELIGFAKTGALTAGEMKVYDRDASGFLPGEGCGFVALKRLEDARTAGDRIYAVIRGWGISSDGKGGITRPDPQGQARAILRAYQRAGYSPRTLDFVEGHGTGTPVGDRAELEALALALNSNGDARERTCGVTSLKSILGHTKAAAGVGALIKATLAANRRILPPTAGCTHPSDVFDNAAKALYSVRYGQAFDSRKKLRAGVSAMGFGGINAHVTLESGDPPLAKLRPHLDERALLASSQESEIFVFGGSTIGAVRDAVTPVANIAERISDGELVDLARHLASALPSAATVRAAVTASSPDQLAEALRHLLDVLNENPPTEGEVHADARRGVWIGNAAQRRRIGFLLPGQGSQQLGMARVLVERYEWARRLGEQLDRSAKENGGEPITPFIFRPLDRAKDERQLQSWRRALAQTEIAQPAICFASVLYAKHLANLGVTPDVVGGHSLGELTALHLAGAFDEETLLRFALLRGRVMTEAGERSGAMAALRCSAEKAETLLHDAPGHLAVANINSPRQTVISGEKSAVDDVLARAGDAGVRAAKLNVSGAFHSQLMQGAAERLAKEADLPIEFEAAHVGLLSSVEGCDFRAQLDLRDHFANQAVSRVNFMELVQAMSARCDLLMEVGPGAVLTNLTRQTLKSDSLLCLPIASKPGRDRDLNAALATAFIHGAPVRWEALYEGRLARPFISPDDRLFIDNPCERPFKSNRVDVAGLQLPQLAAESAATEEDGEERSAANAESNDEAALTNGKLDATLLKLVHRQTGYPVESIPMSSRLLEDLNLDSIKAAEFVAEAAERAGVASRLDPTRFANATLLEIAEAIRAAQTGAPAAEASDSLLADVALPEDAQWVRNFAIEYELDEAPDIESRSWKSQRVRILTEDGEQEIAAALAKQLRAAGADVEMLSYADAEQTHLDGENAAHVIAVLPQDATDPSLRRIVAQLRLPVVVTASQKNASITYVQLGDENRRAAGFAQSVHHERPDLRVRVVQLNERLKPQLMAQAVLQEHTVAGAFASAVYDRELRRYAPVAKLHQPASYRPRQLQWSADDVILITGGAKGVTAECALALGRETGAKLALVGSSPAPAPDDRESEIARTLRRAREADVACAYYSCDITDADAVRDLVERVRSELGPITGLVHGAGMNRPRPAHTVGVDEALSEIRPKVVGARNLFAALGDAPPRMVVSLTSIIGVTGMPGNSWYAFSNEMLAGMTQQFAVRHEGCDAVSIAYSVWDEVGIGARLGSVEKLAKLGIGAISVKEGVKRFLQIFHADADAREVVVTARLGGLDSWRREELPAPRGFRFIENVEYLEPQVELRATARLSLDRDPYVHDHVYNGSYLFPTVFGLEAMAQAAAYVTGQPQATVARIENITLERPVVVDPQEGAVIGLIAQAAETDGGEQAVRVRLRTKRTGMAHDHFAATVVLAPKLPQRSEDWAPSETLDIEPHRDLYGELLFQGERFQRMEAVYSADSLHAAVRTHAVSDARAVAASFGEQDSSRLLLGDPYFSDLLLQSVQLIIPEHDCLPVSIGRLERFASGAAPLSRDQQSQRNVRAELRHRGQREHISDVTAVDEHGAVVAKLTDYHVRVLGERANCPTAEELASPGERDERIVRDTLNTACEALHIAAPSIALAHAPHAASASQQERRALAASLVGRNLRELAGSSNGKRLSFRIVSNEAGKPQLEGKGAKGFDLSLSHDECYLLAVVGRGEQGCDIEPITSRKRARWETILGAERSAVLDELIGHGDSLDAAATRIWSALEAVRKADNHADPVFTIHSRSGDSVLLKAKTASGLHHIVTTPLKLTRRPDRMLAVRVTPVKARNAAISVAAPRILNPEISANRA